MKKKASINLTVDDYMKMRYTIMLTPDDDLGWFAKIEELPGCMSDGKSPEIAVSNLRETQREWIAAALEDVGSIPLPKCMQKYSGQFLVRTTPMLHRRLAETADTQGVSTNQLSATLLAGGLVGESLQEQMENLAAKVDGITKRLEMIMPAEDAWELQTSKAANIMAMPLGTYSGAQSKWRVEEATSAEA